MLKAHRLYCPWGRLLWLHWRGMRQGRGKDHLIANLVCNFHALGPPQRVLKGCSNYLKQRALLLSWPFCSRLPGAKQAGDQVAGGHVEKAQGPVENKATWVWQLKLERADTKSQSQCHSFLPLLSACGKLDFSLAKGGRGRKQGVHSARAAFSWTKKMSFLSFLVFLLQIFNKVKTCYR